jgi:hypothetical protein
MVPSFLASFFFSSKTLIVSSSLATAAAVQRKRKSAKVKNYDTGEERAKTLTVCTSHFEQLVMEGAMGARWLMEFVMGRRR